MDATRKLYGHANRLLSSAAQTIVGAQAGLATLQLLQQRLISLIAKPASAQSTDIPDVGLVDPTVSLSVDWRTLAADEYLKVLVLLSCT